MVNGVCTACSDAVATTSDPVTVRSYNTPQPAAGATYDGGAYFPTLNRIYFASWGASATWTYIDANIGTAVNFQHGQSNLVSTAYVGAGYCSGVDRLYFIPHSQAPQPAWHYIDNQGTMISYNHGMTGLAGGAYADGSVLESMARFYFAPYVQSPLTTWHYVDCNTGNVVPYSAPSLGSLGYHGAAHAASLKRIYFAPYTQSSFPTWHYIDSDGSLKEYPVPVPAVGGGYMGAAWSAVLDRVYFAPCGQSSQPNWHYIDCRTGGTVVTYPAIANSFLYNGVVYAPVQGRVYFIPRSGTAPTTNLNYVDKDGLFKSYPTGLAIPGDGYWGGVLSPKENRVYFVPQATYLQTSWQYLSVGCKCGTSYAECPV